MLYFPILGHAKGNQHGGREKDDLQNWLDMTSHENPLLFAMLNKLSFVTESNPLHAFCGRNPQSSGIPLTRGFVVCREFFVISSYLWPPESKSE